LTARTLLVTGTDTGIGKTTVSARLAAALATTGARVAYWKPVETGIPAGEPAADAGEVQRVAGASVTVRTTLRLPEPLAPAVAAVRAGTAVDLRRLDEDFAALRADHDWLIVEGAGGWLVPVTPEATWRELAIRWSLPVLLVVGNRLGCLSHAFLTAESIAAAGRPLVGWVLNALTDQPGVAEVTNRDALTARLGPPLAELAYPVGDRAMFDLDRRSGGPS
jgi:dethiobiotin synthetase